MIWSLLFWESIWDITTNICCFETFFLRHHNQHLLFWDILDITTNICCFETFWNITTNICCFETFWNITTNICKQLTSGLDGCSWVLPSRTWRNLYPICWVWPMCGHLSLVTQGTIRLERSWLELACWSPHHHRQLVAHHGMETYHDWTIQTWQNAGPVQTCTDPMLGHQTPLFHRMGTWRIYEPMIRGPVIYRLYIVEGICSQHVNTIFASQAHGKESHAGSCQLLLRLWHEITIPGYLHESWESRPYPIEAIDTCSLKKYSGRRDWLSWISEVLIYHNIACIVTWHAGSWNGSRKKGLQGSINGSRTCTCFSQWIAAMHGRSCVKNRFPKCHSLQSPLCLTLSQTMRKQTWKINDIQNKFVNGIVKASTYGRAISSLPALQHPSYECVGACLNRQQLPNLQLD